MASTQLDICNRVSQKLGGPLLTSLAGTAADSQPITTALKRVFWDAFLAELRTHNWNFAIRRTSISAPYVTITAVTAAEPPVVTYIGTDPDNGDKVYIEDVLGMTELNGNYYRIANINKTSNTFELVDVDTLENIDGTAFTAYTSAGTATICPYYGFLRKYPIPDYNATITFTDTAGGSLSASETILVNWSGHNLPIGAPVWFTTTGTLPTASSGITANVKYYVVSANYGDNSFCISNTLEGTALTYTSGGSGTHTGHSVGFVRLLDIDGMYGVTANYGGVGYTNDFSIEGRYLVCNDSGPIFIRYLSPNFGVADMDSLFTEALACRIALDCTVEIKQDDANFDRLRSDYAQAISIAKRADAIETPGEIMPEDGWLMSRY